MIRIKFRGLRSSLATSPRFCSSRWINKFNSRWDSLSGEISSVPSKVWEYQFHALGLLLRIRRTCECSQGVTACTDPYEPVPNHVLRCFGLKIEHSVTVVVPFRFFFVHSLSGKPTCKSRPKVHQRKMWRIPQCHSSRQHSDRSQ